MKKLLIGVAVVAVILAIVLVIQVGNTNKLNTELDTNKATVAALQPLKGELDEVKQQLDVLTAEKLDLSTQLDTAKKGLEESAMLTANLSEEKDALNAELELQKVSVASLDPLKSELDGLKQQFDLLTAEKQRISTEFDAAKASLEAADALATSLAAEKEALNAELYTQKAAVAALEPLKAELEGVKQQFDLQTAENSRISAEFETAKKSLEESNTLVTSLTAQKQALSTELDAQKVRVAALEPLKGQLEDVKQLLTGEKQDIANELETAKNGLKEAEKALANLTEEKDALAKELDAQKEAVASLQPLKGELDDVKGQLKTLTSEKQDIINQLDTANKALEKAEMLAKNLAAEKESLSAELDLQKKTVASLEPLQGELDGANKHVESLTAQKQEIETELLAANDQINTLTETAKAAEKAKADALKEVEDMKAEAAKSVEAVKAEAAADKEQIKALEGIIASSQSQPAETQVAVVEATPEAIAATLAPAGDKAKASIWHTFTKGQEAYLQKAVADFNASQGEYQIELLSQPYEGFLGSVRSAVVEGIGPDIIFNYASEAASYVKPGLVADLGQYIYDDEIGIKDFEGSLVDGVMNGEVKAFEDGLIHYLPAYTTGPIFFYNKTLFEELNLKVPTNWEEMETVSKAIFDAKGIPALGFDSLTDLVQMFIMETPGAGYIDVENKQVLFDTPEVRAKIEWLIDLVKKGYFLVKSSGNYFSEDFNSGIVAGYIGSSAGYPYIKPVDDSFQFGMAPVPAQTWFPSWNRGPIVFYYKDDMRVQAAYEFVKYFITPEVNAGWTEAVVALAPYSWTKENEGYKAFIAQDTLEGQALQAVEANLDIAGSLPAVEGANVVRDALKAAIEKAALGDMSVEDAWTEAITVSNAALKGE